MASERTRVVGRVTKADGTRATARLTVEPVGVPVGVSVQKIAVELNDSGRFRVSLVPGTYRVRGRTDVWLMVVPREDDENQGVVHFKDIAEREPA